MSFFSDIRDKVQFSKVPEAFRRSGMAVLDFLSRNDTDDREVKRGVAGMVKAILISDSGEISSAHWTILRDIADHFSPSDSIALLNGIQDAEPSTPESAAQLLQDVPRPDKEKLVFFLLALSLADNVPDDRLTMVEEFAQKIGFSVAETDSICEEVIKAKNKRIQLLRSGTGVLIVLGIVAIFLLLATWLRPVAFGLILAYLLLPLEKFFERRIREKRGLGYHFFQFLYAVFSPLRRLSHKIKNKHHKAKESDEQIKKKDAEHRIVNRAVLETMFFVVLLITCVTVLFSRIIYAQVRDSGQKIGVWMMQTPPAAGAEATPSPFAPTIDYLDRTAEKYSQIPPVRSMLQSISDTLDDPQKMRELLQMFLQKNGGAFSLTADILGFAASCFFDLLLTIFFGIFFLTKLSEFCREDDSTGRQGEYLVRMIYNGKWLPGAEEAAVSEATRLTGGMLVRLRIWVRGYLTLILIDMCVFTTFFAIFGLPYFPILGLIAGCSQLLPYLGPILTAGITLLVTLACGGTGTQLLLIVLLYLIYNGILEQFVIYPAIIGDSLGLTTLETIIVVLLGAVVAGIPGMILAMPMASIAKYLVPQIYRCWEIRRRPLPNEQPKI